MLVIGGVAIVAAYANRERLALKIESVYLPVTPKPVSPGTPGRRANGAFSGDARWALSALPECFTQLSRTTGPRGFVAAHLPKDAIPVPPATTVVSADCRVFARADAVWAWRGEDRLRVPPPALLYESRSAAGGRMLELLQGSRNAYDLRVYSMTPAEQQ